MIHTRTHRPTDKFNNGTLYAPRYEEDFSPIGKNGLIMNRFYVCLYACVDAVDVAVVAAVSAVAVFGNNHRRRE